MATNITFTNKSFRFFDCHFSNISKPQVQRDTQCCFLGNFKARQPLRVFIAVVCMSNYLQPYSACAADLMSLNCLHALAVVAEPTTASNNTHVLLSKCQTSDYLPSRVSLKILRYISNKLLMF